MECIIGKTPAVRPREYLAKVNQITIQMQEFLLKFSLKTHKEKSLCKKLSLGYFYVFNFQIAYTAGLKSRSVTNSPYDVFLAHSSPKGGKISFNASLLPTNRTFMRSV